MDAMKILLNVVEVVVVAYFGFASIYIFIFAFAGLFKAKRRRKYF